MKSNILVAFALLLFIIASCDKNDSSSDIPNPPSPADTTNNTTTDTSNNVPGTLAADDTLSSGWKKTIISGQPSLFDIYFINNTGFALATIDSFNNRSIYKSTDGGNSWNNIFPERYIENIGMGSEMNAAFVGQNKIISTQNGGINFDTIFVADNYLTDVFYINSQIAYAVGQHFWKTTDAGLHWIKLYDFSNNGGYQTMHFINEQTGWVIRREGLYKTTDGGINWQLINTSSSQLNLNGGAGVVFFTDSTRGLIANINSVAATADGGSSWNKVYTGTSNYHDLHFVNNTTGYMTDGNNILKTIDGGATWKKEVVIPNVTLIELHFIDANHGWACGGKGVILKFEK